MSKRNVIHEKSFLFAKRITKVYYKLLQQREYIISKQLMRSGTAVGALVRESSKAESRKDFVHKLSIASKEAYEAYYWLELLEETEEIKIDVSGLKPECEEIMKILNSILLTIKQKS